MSIELDNLDRTILGRLEHDGRASYSALARSTRRGRDTVEYRVRRLVDSGVIKGFRAVVDFYRLGFHLHKVYMRLSCTRERRKRFIEQTKRHDRVMWIAECSGEWDAIVAVAARSMHELYDLAGLLLGDVSGALTATEVYTVVQFWVYRSRRIVAPSAGSFELGAAPGNTVLDALELELLRIVAVDSRLPITELASRVGVSEAVVRKRLEHLERDGIILGYQADLDIEKLGLTHYKAQLYLHSWKSAEEKKLAAFCSGHPAVVAYMRQIGPCRVEVELHARDYPEYASILDDIRAKFPELIRETRTVLLRIQHFNWNVLSSADAG